MSRKIAFGGIFTGLAVILLYLTALIPTGKLALYFLASLPVAFAIIELGAGAGAAVYAAAGALSVFATGNLYAAVPFLFFFGHYPIMKYLIEKNRSAAAEILLKLAVFNLSLALAFIFFKSLFFNALSSVPLNSSVIIAVSAVAAQGAFFLYDYVFSRIICYYESRINLFRKG